MAKGNSFGAFLFGTALGAAYVFFTRTEKGKNIVEAGKACLNKACDVEVEPETETENDDEKNQEL